MLRLFFDFEKLLTFGELLISLTKYSKDYCIRISTLV